MPVFARLTFAVATAAALWMGDRAVAQAPAAPRTLRVYHVGNSVTDTINYRALAAMATARGHAHVFGRHMIPGAPLAWIWDHPADGFQEQPFGHYPTALVEFEWDAITLQPFDRLLDGDDESDLAVASRFIDLALKNPANADAQFYVYSRWPRRPTGPGHTDQAPKYEPLDYAGLWERKYTGGWDNTNETRDYFERLLVLLQDKYADLAKPVRMVPVGDVMLELDRRMRAGRVPGYAGVEQLYTDGIHLGDAGSFVVGTTFYATLYREDPRGLPADAYKVSDAALAAAIQDAVWDVVSEHPHAGVLDVGGE